MTDTPTTEEIAQHYTAMGHSVDLLNAGQPEDMEDADWTDTVSRNVEHLQLMVAKDFWTIPTLEHEIADGGVYIAHWRCTGVDDDGNTASSYGTCGLTYDASAADFTPYDDITEAQAQGWVWGHVSQSDTEAAIASKIDAIDNPTTEAGVPWAA